MFDQGRQARCDHETQQATVHRGRCDRSVNRASNAAPIGGRGVLVAPPIGGRGVPRPYECDRVPKARQMKYTGMPAPMMAKVTSVSAGSVTTALTIIAAEAIRKMIGVTG